MLAVESADAEELVRVEAPPVQPVTDSAASMIAVTSAAEITLRARRISEKRMGETPFADLRLHTDRPEQPRRCYGQYGAGALCGP
jgi:hypothetical protein